MRFENALCQEKRRSQQRIVSHYGKLEPEGDAGAAGPRDASSCSFFRLRFAHRLGPQII
jgi:hypothetical protein